MALYLLKATKIFHNSQTERQRLKGRKEGRIYLIMLGRAHEGGGFQGAGSAGLLDLGGP